MLHRWTGLHRGRPAIPRPLHARAKSLAAWKGRTLRVWVTRAIEAAVDRQETERAEEERRRRR